jgi:DNA repair exonuclease SbcCD ATPase subunit
MIPLRVRLRGFLSYKDEQEVAFDGAPVWLLAGLNGSGKSSIFDAVTYALFGSHRGGSTNAVELINKDCDKALVEFEFALEGRRYQITRTLQRTKQGTPRSSQQLEEYTAGGAWEPLEGANKKEGLNRWVVEHIGLNYETFTSSVLLLQGRAEKLLDSTAKGRFEVLAGIVDLDRYERLHKRADEERKALDAGAKNTRERLNALPEVSAVSLLEAEGRIEASQKERAAAEAEWERCRALELQAARWEELQNKLAAARQRLAALETTLGDAAAIEADFARLHELNAVIPRLQEFVAERGRVQTAERELAELTRQREAAAQEARQLAEQDRQLRELRDRLLKAADRDERTLQQLVDEVRRLHGQVAKLNEAEGVEQQKRQLFDDLKQLPADPEAAARKARDELEQTRELQQALTPLTRLHDQREQLGHAAEHERKAAAELARQRKEGEALRSEFDRLKPAVEEAAAARSRAEQAAAVSRTLAEQARRQLSDFLLTDGAKVCRLCGQALTAAHWQQENARRTEEQAAAENRARESAAALQQAEAADAEAKSRLAVVESKLTQAREAFKTQDADARQARNDVDRLRRECAASYHEVPTPFRSRVGDNPGDWLTSTYPTMADLDAARQQTSRLSALRRVCDDANQQQAAWNKKQGELAAVEQALQRLRADLPANGKVLREQHAAKAAQEKVVADSLAARRRQAVETQEQLDKLARKRAELQEHQARLGHQAAEQETTRRHGQENLERARKALPLAWQAQTETIGTADVHRLTVEQSELVATKTEERARHLQEARGGLEFHRHNVAALEVQQAEFTPEARLGVIAARGRAQEVGRLHKARETELTAARQARDLLEQRRRDRATLEDELRLLEQEQTHARLLAELLSRDRLQLHLVRQAERQVVDHANAVLDRLSGGQLYLRLAGQAGGEDASTKALELEAHNRHTGERPINVAFLSGSQRFRVAVSLALGIGQYASRQHRPLESVIIDEGFGCLDRFGRQLMIQELQNLRGQMRCILLVSHQEEFADAFSDGYRFELSNGSTVATRFQR